jgi:hypothetical protein
MLRFSKSKVWLVSLILIFPIHSRADSTDDLLKPLLELLPIVKANSRLLYLSPEDGLALLNKARAKADSDLIKSLVQLPIVTPLNTQSSFTSLEERLAFVKSNPFFQKLDAKIDEAVAKEPNLQLTILSEARRMTSEQQTKIINSMIGPFSRELQMELEEITYRLERLNLVLQPTVGSVVE